MSAFLFFSRFHEFKSMLKQNYPGFTELMRLLFVAGPMQLLAKGVSRKCASLMILMCIPSLVVCAVLTIPGLLFQTPNQHAFYYFSLTLGQEPLRWLAIGLAAICTLASLAMPKAIDRG